MALMTLRAMIHVQMCALEATMDTFVTGHGKQGNYTRSHLTLIYGLSWRRVYTSGGMPWRQERAKPLVRRQTNTDASWCGRDALISTPRFSSARITT